MFKELKIEFFLLILVYLAALYFPIFLRLDVLPLHAFDEARNAINAFEMCHNGHYLNRYFDGKLDEWVPKPPLLIWAQVICMKIFGYNELAVRLPIALSVLATVYLMIRFFQKEFDNLLAGLLAGLVLVCTNGYINYHAARNGDHDVPLALILTAGMICFYKYLSYPEKRNKYLCYSALLIVAGIFLKSVAGLMFLPAYFLFAIYDKKLVSVLTHKAFYLAMLGVVLIVGTYYISSEINHPGFLKLVWEEELIPRYTNTSTTHNFNEAPSKWFYTSLVWNWYLKYFSWLVPISLLLIFIVNKDKGLRRFAILLVFTILSYLFIISNGTINAWYTVPLFPPVAMLVGMGLTLTMNKIIQLLKIEKRSLRIALIITMSLLFFYQPYRFIVEKVYNKVTGQEFQYGLFLKKMKRHDPQVKDFFVYYEKGNTSYEFYEKVYSKIYGYNFRSCRVDKDIANCDVNPTIGDKVIVCYNDMYDGIKLLYEIKELRKFKGCYFLEIKSIKNKE